jgi:hypothetical protein
MTTIDMYNVGSSSTFYSAYQLSKLNEYLDKQNKNHDYYYTARKTLCCGDLLRRMNYECG